MQSRHFLKAKALTSNALQGQAIFQGDQCKTKAAIFLKLYQGQGTAFVQSQGKARNFSQGQGMARHFFKTKARKDIFVKVMQLFI